MGAPFDAAERFLSFEIRSDGKVSQQWKKLQKCHEFPSTISESSKEDATRNKPKFLVRNCSEFLVGQKQSKTLNYKLKSPHDITIIFLLSAWSKTLEHE